MIIGGDSLYMMVTMVDSAQAVHKDMGGHIGGTKSTRSMLEISNTYEMTLVKLTYRGCEEVQQ